MSSGHQMAAAIRWLNDRCDALEAKLSSVERRLVIRERSNERLEVENVRLRSNVEAGAEALARLQQDYDGVVSSIDADEEHGADGID